MGKVLNTFRPRSIGILFSKGIEFYIYSSIHIALCVISITWLTFYFFKLSLDSVYLPFVGFSTLFLYSLHRVVGLEKMREFHNLGRYSVVVKYKYHIYFYGLLGACGSLYFSLHLARIYQVIFLLLGLISMSYSLPLFPGQRRLRDFPFVKIFAIGFTWAMVILLPKLVVEEKINFTSLVYFIEQFCFILAISIPFDIRDREVDKSMNLPTLATVFGNQLLHKLILSLLSCSVICVLFLFYWSSYSIIDSILLILFYITTLTLCLLSHRMVHNYFFIGVLDGTMILKALMLCAGSILFP